MEKFTRDSDPTNVYDDVEPEEQSRPRKTASIQKERNQSRRGRGGKPKVIHKDQPRTKSTQRPADVSERVWALAEQWMDAGTAHFGRRPPVNQAEFSKRLAAKINTDPQLLVWFKKPVGYWDQFDWWESAYDFVNDVVARAMEMFFEFLTEDQKPSTVQWAFLGDEWDEWIYQAIDSVKIRWIRRHVAEEAWQPMSLPTAVFDPTTVGAPDPDALHPDQEFWPGKTYREVQEINERDLDDLQPLPDEDYEQMYAISRARLNGVVAGYATATAAMVAKRGKTTTKEH